MDAADTDQIILGPKVIQTVDKICRYLYPNGNITENIANLIGMRTEINSSKEFLNSLSTKEMLSLIKEIFTDKDFKNLIYSNWNNFGDFVKEWPDELGKVLKSRGITYDDTQNKFFYNSQALDSNVEFNAVENFLQIDLEDVLYNDLISEINKCYKYKLPTATFILCRKLVENLLIDVIRVKFHPTGDINKYYDTSKRRFLDFSKLITNLKTEKKNFLGYENIIDKIVSLSSNLRETANESAHSIFPINQVEDLEKLKIPLLVKSLYGLFNRIKN